MAAAANHHLKDCPFCDIAARAPRTLNRAALSQYRDKRRGGGEDDSTTASAAVPPPFFVLPCGGQTPARLVFADRRVVAFVDRSPCAEQHLLVCPRTHVPNVSTLLDAAAQGRRLPLWAGAAGGGGDDDDDDDDNDNDSSISAADLADHMRAVGEALLWQRSCKRRGAAVEAGGNTESSGNGAGGRGGGSGGGSSSGSASSFFRFGYHVPPWRSVDHLHLHCIEPPFRPPALEVKYRLEWLNWLPDDRLRARLVEGAAAAAAAGGEEEEGEDGRRPRSRRRRRGACGCWPLGRRAGEGGGGSDRKPLVPPHD